MTPHLDAERWAALLEGRLPKEEARRLSEHLEEGCETCEAFLAEREEADPLDGWVDDALLELGPPPEVRRDDLAFERVRRAARRRPTGLMVALGGAVALAAAVLLMVVVPAEVPSPQRLKGVGGETAPKLSLDVLATSPDGPPVPLAKNATVVAGSVLVFRVRLEKAACVQLWLRDDAGLEPLLDRPDCLDAGTHTLTSRRGDPLGLPVDEAGELELWLTPEVGVRALRRELRAGSPPPGADRFPLHVAASPP